MIEFGDLVDPLQNELQSNLFLPRRLVSLSFWIVYRDNTKGDKNRKTAGAERNNSVGKGKAKEGESISSAPRPKGKAKSALPPPFTTQPLSTVLPSAPHTTEDVEMSVPVAENEEMGEAEGGEDYVQELGEEVEEPAADYETEEEVEAYDESEELRRDAAGLGGAPPLREDHQM